MSKLDLQVDVTEEFDPKIPNYLPHNKTFSIQVGSKLFYLSGASLSSDGPSYFTHYFGQGSNVDNVLFIDRDPTTFVKIYNHLQGYAIDIENDYDFVRLWVDSAHFGLRRLQNLLIKDDVFVSIGNKPLKVPRSLLSSAGNNRNFFTVACSALYVDSFDLLKERKLIRPPPQRPISVPSHSAELFEDLLEIFRGNHTVIKNDEHRHLLAKECRYYRFLELEQRIISHRIIQNPFTETGQEILINLLDLQYNGISRDNNSNDALKRFLYSRPFIPREPKRNLLIEINNESHQNSMEIANSKILVERKNGICRLYMGNKLGKKFRQVFSDYDRSILGPCVSLEKDSEVVTAQIESAETYINDTEAKEDWLSQLTGIWQMTDQLEQEEQEPQQKKPKLQEDKEEPILMELHIVKSIWEPRYINDVINMKAIKLDIYTDVSKFTKKVVKFL